MKIAITNLGNCPIIIDYIKKTPDLGLDEELTNVDIDIDEKVVLHDVARIVSVTPEDEDEDIDDGEDSDEDEDEDFDSDDESENSDDDDSDEEDENNF